MISVKAHRSLSYPTSHNRPHAFVLSIADSEIVREIFIRVDTILSHSQCDTLKLKLKEASAFTCPKHTIKTVRLSGQMKLNGIGDLNEIKA